MKGIRTKLTFAFGCILAGSMANAATLLVPSQYATIADAVAAATSGEDVIHVTQAGSYAGFVINNKDLEVVNTSGGTVTITSIVNIDGSPAVTIDGFVINTAGANGVAINNAGSTVTIKDCTITGCDQGIRINDDNTVILDGTAVTENARGVVRDGNDPAGSVSILNGSQVNGNTGRGIEIYRPISLTIENSTVNENGDDGIFLDNQPGAEIILRGAHVNENNGRGLALSRGVALEVTEASRIRFNNGIGIQRINGAGQETSILISNSSVSNNTPDNIDIVENADLTIVDSDVNNSGRYGLRLRDRGVGDLILLRSDFFNNEMANFRIENTSGAGATTLAVDRSRFARSGGGADRDNVFFTNVALAEGSAFTNSILHEGRWQFSMVINSGATSHLRFDHCSVVSRFGTTGDGIRLASDNGSTINATVYNSIIIGADRALNFLGNATVNAASDYNIVWGQHQNHHNQASPGDNDLVEVDPLFVTPTTGNLNNANLSPGEGSPAIDAANAALSPDVSEDFLGKPRPIGAGPDIGAIEAGDASVDVFAERATINVDGDPADWTTLASETITLDTGGRGDLVADVRFAWDDDNLYILIAEQTGDTTLQEAGSQAQFAEPFNFDSVSFFMDLNMSMDAEPRRDLNPWFGFSSTGRTDLFVYRANNDTTFIAASLPNSLIRTSGTLGSRVIEAAIAWEDIDLVVSPTRLPDGGMAANAAVGLRFGCEPLLVDDDFNSQSFIGGSQYGVPSGDDPNSRNILLGEAARVGEWTLMH